MAPSILSLPPELVLEILGSLPVCSLLRFGSTCRAAHEYAMSSLHALNLDFCTCRMPQCLVSLNSHSPLENVVVHVEDSCAYAPTTLFSFQSALTKSILCRHAVSLRSVKLTLWTLSLPVAKAIAGLPSLRSLEINIEASPFERRLPRVQIGALRREETKAWDYLARNNAWAARLRKLTLRGGEIDTNQLSAVLEGTQECQELTVNECRFVGTGVWGFLGEKWKGRRVLRYLKIGSKGARLDQQAMRAIGRMNGLKRLDLAGYHTDIATEVWDNWNEETWRLEEFVKPSSALRLDCVLEVDPAYAEDDDEAIVLREMSRVEKQGSL